jgi:hypothetical protein
MAQASAAFRPGTYALRLCRVTCDAHYPKNTLRTGWIVLDTAPLNLSRFPDSTRRPLELSFIMMADRGPANGCFHFTSNRIEVPTYAGTSGLVRWQHSDNGDSVTFQLYQSPDAGHDVQVAPTASGFAGVGHSWGAGVAAVDYPDDLVVADYIGPPNVAHCAEAGVAFLAEMRTVAAMTDSMFRGPPCDSARAVRAALDSVNKLNAFRSVIDQFGRLSGWTRIVTRPASRRVRDGTVVLGLDGRCRIRSLVP